MNVVKEFCRERYNNVYNAEKARLTQEALSASRSGRLSEEAESKIETTAQKEAIQQATIDSMRNLPDVGPQISGRPSTKCMSTARAASTMQRPSPKLSALTKAGKNPAATLLKR